jgi:NAD(P)-dependent dehydrogenase (short-subunit alcohol dehydrogenase family)
MLLKDKVAVISGAASRRGIGLATARLFVQHGARVAILDLDDAACRRAAESLGPGHLGLACDVTDPEACRAVAQRILAETGQVDAVISIAGITQPLKLMEISSADWDAVSAVSAKGTLFLSQAFVPHMRQRKKGSIACISSVSAQRGGGLFGGAHYSAAKAAVVGLTKAMARELGPDGIRVNCVSPGTIMTDITGGVIEGMKDELAKSIPLSRLGTPEDVAGVFVFLASDLSAYITGFVIDVNGGLLIH